MSSGVELKELSPAELSVLIAPECFVRPGQVKLLLGVSEPIANRIRKGDTFPRMREISPGVYAYLKSEIISWMHSSPIVDGAVIKDGQAA